MRMQALKSHYKGAKQFKLTATLIKPIKNNVYLSVSHSNVYVFVHCEVLESSFFLLLFYQWL